MARSRYGKKNRYKFKTYTFKLTFKQNDLVSRCAKMKHITTNKLIKNALKDYLLKYEEALEYDSYVAENQLSLFNTGTQLSIFDEIEKKD
jgi:hypothetical protein